MKLSKEVNFCHYLIFTFQIGISTMWFQFKYMYQFISQVVKYWREFNAKTTIGCAKTWSHNRILFLELKSKMVKGEGGDTPETCLYPWEVPHALTNSAIGMSSPCADSIPRHLNTLYTNLRSDWISGRGVDMPKEGVHIPWIYSDSKLAQTPQIMQLSGTQAYGQNALNYAHLLCPYVWYRDASL